jgi:hypothetical protein
MARLQFEYPRTLLVLTSPNRKGYLQYHSVAISENSLDRGWRNNYFDHKLAGTGTRDQATSKSNPARSQGQRTELRDRSDKFKTQIKTWHGHGHGTAWWETPWERVRHRPYLLDQVEGEEGAKVRRAASSRTRTSTDSDPPSGRGGRWSGRGTSCGPRLREFAGAPRSHKSQQRPASQELALLMLFCYESMAMPDRQVPASPATLRGRSREQKRQAVGKESCARGMSGKKGWIDDGGNKGETAAESETCAALPTHGSLWAYSVEAHHLLGPATSEPRKLVFFLTRPGKPNSVWSCRQNQLKKIGTHRLMTTLQTYFNRDEYTAYHVVTHVSRKCKQATNYFAYTHTLYIIQKDWSINVKTD